MGTTLNKKAYQQMIDEDIAELKKHWQGDSLERRHVLHILEDSPGMYYPEKTPSAVVEKMAEALKEAVEYLSITIFDKGQPVRLNNIGADSILHRNMFEALAEYQSLSSNPTGGISGTIEP